MLTVRQLLSPVKGFSLAIGDLPLCDADEEEEVLKSGDGDRLHLPLEKGGEELCFGLGSLVVLLKGYYDWVHDEGGGRAEQRTAEVGGSMGLCELATGDEEGGGDDGGGEEGGALGGGEGASLVDGREFRHDRVEVERASLKGPLWRDLWPEMGRNGRGSHGS